MSITNKNQIIETISNMSVMEIMELITAMEEKFGVSATAAIVPSVDTESNKVIDNVVEEQTEFNVILKSIGVNKIAVIKAVRSNIGLGLKEAKDLVESAPITLKEDLKKDDAEALKKILEEAGAEVEIK